MKEKHQAANEKIAFVEDRFNRNIHIEELEQAAIKAVRDGYNRGIAENTGRMHGVSRRTTMTGKIKTVLLAASISSSLLAFVADPRHQN